MQSVINMPNLSSIAANYNLFMSPNVSATASLLYNPIIKKSTYVVLIEKK